MRPGFSGQAGLPGIHIKRGAYTGGPTWQLWMERTNPWRSEIVFEAVPEIVAMVAREERVNDAFAFRLLCEQQCSYRLIVRRK